MIYPSSLFTPTDSNGSSSYEKTYQNTMLRIGIVLKVYETDDEKNINKVVPEYDVMALEQEQQYGLNSTIYKSCVSYDGFGGVADFFQAKLRPVKDSRKTEQKINFQDETGSIVLLLCIDGNSDRAMIIKSFPSNQKQVLTKDKGIHLEGEYNGINYQINKDGELTVTFRSATNDDGTAKDTAAGGSFLKIDKTGSIELNDNNKESIRIDKEKKTIDVKAEKDISNTTDANFNVTAKQNANVKVQDLVATCQGKVLISAKGTSAIKVDAALTVTTPNLQVKASSSVNVQSNSIQLLGNQVTIGKGAQPAIIPTTVILGRTAGGSPVVSRAIGPFSSSVLIGV